MCCATYFGFSVDEKLYISNKGLKTRLKVHYAWIVLYIKKKQAEWQPNSFLGFISFQETRHTALQHIERMRGSANAAEAWTWRRNIEGLYIITTEEVQIIHSFHCIQSLKLQFRLKCSGCVWKPLYTITLNI